MRNILLGVGLLVASSFLAPPSAHAYEVEASYTGALLLRVGVELSEHAHFTVGAYGGLYRDGYELSRGSFGEVRSDFSAGGELGLKFYLRDPLEGAFVPRPPARQLRRHASPPQRRSRVGPRVLHPSRPRAHVLSARRDRSRRGGHARLRRASLPGEPSRQRPPRHELARDLPPRRSLSRTRRLERPAAASSQLRRLPSASHGDPTSLGPRGRDHDDARHDPGEDDDPNACSRDDRTLRDRTLDDRTLDDGGVDRTRDRHDSLGDERSTCGVRGGPRSVRRSARITRPLIMLRR